jgi:hypothetical protein
MGKPHQPSDAAVLIGLGGQNRINPQVLRDRVREREAREQADNRSPAEVWLGDPPPERSALAQRTEKARNGEGRYGPKWIGDT